MAEDFPEEFDLVVIGTGLPESCVAAAASRVGKTVLHIDPNDYYGGAWASFNLEALTALLDRHATAASGAAAELRNASQRWHCKEEAGDAPSIGQADNGGAQVQDMQNTTSTSSSEATAGEEWTKTRLLQHSRRFNLDLSPRVLYAAGEFVQLLISSNICRYAEFRAVDRVCTRFADDILSVPCSRSDVFNTQALGIVEKRLLMKFLTLCMTLAEQKSDEDAAEFGGKTFLEYLQQQQMTPKISTCIMQAIAMCDADTPFEVGMQRTQLFLASLGRYGNTPFLFPMYGCGELPQCFCRLCAVFGGLYCLKRRVAQCSLAADGSAEGISLVLQEDGSGGSTGITFVEKQERPLSVRAKRVVCSPANLPPMLAAGTAGGAGLVAGHGPLVNGLSRGIFLAASPLGSDELNAGGGGVNVLRLLADDGGGGREALLIQLSHYSGCCPSGVFVYHITTKAASDCPETDLQPFVAQVFAEAANKTAAPKLLYSAHFTVAACEVTAASSASASADPSTLVHCTSAPFYELDYDRSIGNARDIFKRLYGADAEFLPRAPDPEEIVIDGEDPRALSEVNLPDDLRAQLRQLEEATEQMDMEDEEAAAAGGTATLRTIETGSDDAQRDDQQMDDDDDE